jgi:UDP-2,3-diacylglucosamine hydrolase
MELFLNALQHLPEGKKVYVISDLHLGVPDAQSSIEREKKIVRWMEFIRKDAAAIIWNGDIFDFWFEYKFVIPKGFIRFQGKLAEFADLGIPMLMFTGNHDMWMFRYFETELGIPLKRKPMSLTIGKLRVMIGHGDGLGPGDHVYKFQKKFFDSAFCQWLFANLPTGLGMRIAQTWSKHSRLSNLNHDEPFLGKEKEWLWQYAQTIEATNHHDYYIFGHRHLALNVEINENARYLNSGQWVSQAHYIEIDGTSAQLKSFEE